MAEHVVIVRLMSRKKKFIVISKDNVIRRVFVGVKAFIHSNQTSDFFCFRVYIVIELLKKLINIMYIVSYCIVIN